MTHRLSALLLASLLGMLLVNPSRAASPGSEKPPLVRVPPTRKAPTIDGVLSPGEWDDAFMGSGVVGYSRAVANGIDPIGVQYWFTYDAERIYLAGRMETRPGEVYNTRPRALAGGGPSGHFEFLVDGDSCNADLNWVQAMLYALGEYKNVGYSQRIGGYIPFDIDWEYKDAWQDGAWTVELSGPADGLRQGGLADGQTWGVLFAGCMKAGPYYFSGTLGDRFNKRDRYIKMILDRTAPVVRVVDMGDPCSGRAAPRIEIRNRGEAALAIKALFELKSAIEDGDVLQAETRALTVPAGESGVVDWSVAVPAVSPKSGLAPHLFMTLTSADAATTFYEGIYRLGQPRDPKWKEMDEVVAEPIIAEAYLYPYLHRVRVLMDFGGMADPDTVAALHVRVTDRIGMVLGRVRVTEFDNRSGEAVVQLPATLAYGTYRVNCTLVDAAGHVVGEKVETVEKKPFEFEGNRFGVSDKVLAPWTPIKVDAEKRRLEVWNRTYTFDEGGLPAAVVSDGAQVLAGPIRLVEKAGGRITPLVGKSFAFESAADHQAHAVAEAAGEVFTARVYLHAEYDGMLKYEVELGAREGAVIDGLDLVIPLKKEHARFLHAAGDGCRSNYSHALEPGTGRVWDSRAVMNWMMPNTWLSYAWLGDHRRGLCWWADSAEGWTLPRGRKEPVVEVVRNGDVVELVFHIVNREAAALWKGTEPRRLVFALEATPMRPKASWARDIGLCPAEQTKQTFPRFGWIGWTGWCFVGQEKDNQPGGKYTFAHLRPINAEAEAALGLKMAAYKEQNRKPLVYTDMRCRSLVGDVEKAYAWEWAPTLDLRRRAVVEQAPYHRAYRISSTPSRIDYDLWCFKRGMDWGIECWYFDELQNEGQINPATDLGYVDEDGKQMPTGRLFAYRELWKRLYTMMQLDYGQAEPVIVMHNTSTTYAGPMAFCTTTWDYEEANADPAQRQLTKFGIDYLITESMGHQYGFVGSTLGPGGKFEPWLAGHPEEEDSVKRHWMGVHMLLDMNPYLRSDDAVCHGLSLLGEFGWNQADCEWIPYWDAGEQDLYRYTPHERVYVAAYRRGRKLLLIMLNDTNEDITLAWTPGAALPTATMHDAEDPAVMVAPENGAYRVALPHFNYRAMRVDLAQ